MNIRAVKQQSSRAVVFIRKFFYFISLFCSSALLLFCSDVCAVTITADHLEYLHEEDKYTAIGNVRIEKEDALLKADKIILYNKTSDAEATGNVSYNDSETLINTDRAEINLETKTGKLYNAVILLKKSNSWINGENIQKLSEDHYYAATATFTTCDSEASIPPDWCFKGKDVDLIIGKKLIAKDVTYRVRGVPVLYSPYLWTPIETERATGFLFPVIGSSSRKGFRLSPAFFWNIDENRDAIFFLDYYSKRGLGTGIEYRYIDLANYGKWQAFHIRDQELKKDYFELKVTHNTQIGDIKGYLDVNYINQKDFYKEYSEETKINIQRFLQSTGEVSAQFTNSRLYLLGQYWIDLNGENSILPQKLPELGYVINPTRIGPFLFAMNSSIANFYRDEEARGQRLDINPTLYHSFGDAVRFFQSVSLRETAYNLQNGGDYGSSPHRETFQYRASALTRFIKKYDSFTHIIEPSLEYKFIPETRSLPLFDSTELFNKTSQSQFSLLNIFLSKDYLLYARLTQPYDLNGDDKSLLPTALEAFFRGPFILRFDMSYDSNKGRTETVNSEIGFKITDKTIIRAGERYSRQDNILLSAAGIDSALTKNWAINASIWYDLKGNGLRESAVQATYTQQCWTIVAMFRRKPSDGVNPPDYSFTFLIELKGLGAFKI
ncbi:MAG: LPS assembly protein LptD [Thermodesulfovibrionales bacterium]|nr:LPS assembly protein LptD [Thermodesulfovibrionales bacterium]